MSTVKRITIAFFSLRESTHPMKLPQIQDDILDLTGDEEEIGKPVGSDEKNHKTTYVTLKGLERSQRDVEDISKKAIDILEKYDKGDCYLTNLTRFLIHRTH